MPRIVIRNMPDLPEPKRVVDNGERKWKCPGCGKLKTRRADMTRHYLSDKHTDGFRLYACYCCETVFTREDGMKRHMVEEENVRKGCRSKHCEIVDEIDAMSDDDAMIRRCEELGHFIKRTPGEVLKRPKRKLDDSESETTTRRRKKRKAW